MSNIRVSYAEIEAAAARLGAGRDEIIEKLNHLQALIGELVSSGFVTDLASVRFTESYTQYTQSAQQTAQHLTDIQGFLQQTANAMRDMDAEIAARIA